jgi:hypothetical protein
VSVDDITNYCPFMQDETLGCVIRDGDGAYGHHGHCVGCDGNPLEIDRWVARQRQEGRG